ncbi:hypothetical protein S40288_11073 [Stachybotrys chartarum IBT 40288]|nr:hypothetical protein S40288_11073 [Stachybotrys chartarum IBT 40288]
MQDSRHKGVMPRPVGTTSQINDSPRPLSGSGEYWWAKFPQNAAAARFSHPAANLARQTRLNSKANPRRGRSQYNSKKGNCLRFYSHHPPHACEAVSGTCGCWQRQKRSGPTPAPGAFEPSLSIAGAPSFEKAGVTQHSERQDKTCRLPHSATKPP